MDNRHFLKYTSTTPPDLSSLTETGYMTSGTEATDFRGTIPGVAHWHSLGEEIRNAIIAGGLTPDHLSVNQLATIVTTILNSLNVKLDTTQVNQLIDLAITNLINREQAESIVNDKLVDYSTTSTTQGWVENLISGLITRQQVLDILSGALVKYTTTEELNARLTQIVSSIVTSSDVSDIIYQLAPDIIQETLDSKIANYPTKTEVDSMIDDKTDVVIAQLNDLYDGYYGL